MTSAGIPPAECKRFKSLAPSSPNNMAHVIVAMDAKGGIGYQNRLPWVCKEELALFNRKTRGKTVVVGRKTAEALPELRARKVVCVTRSTALDTSGWKNEVTLTHRLDESVDLVDAMIAGGAQIYKEALTRPGLVSHVHMSVVKGEHECDTFFRMEWLDDFVVVEQSEHDDFTHYTLTRTGHGEHQYLKLLWRVVADGERRTGRNGEVLSIFKGDMTFDLRNGFPLLTTKKMFLRGVLEELLFFLRGDTDTSSLSEKKVRIWEGNTSNAFIASMGLPYAKGVMGPMYGYQWRFFNAPYVVDDEGRPSPPRGGIDQLAEVVDLIKSEPHSRRILMTSYNPEQAKLGVLFPCHSITTQFYVQDGYVDMLCYNRSQDAFLGVPFNIASSSLLLMVVGQLTGKVPRFLYMTLGDTHIYSTHMAQVGLQLARTPYSFPSLALPAIASIADIRGLTVDDFVLSDYRYHPSIAAEMVT